MEFYQADPTLENYWRGVIQIYSENGALHFNLYALQNTFNDLLVNLVIGATFVVLPAFWLAALA